MRSFGDEISQLEEHFFVGREEELAIFKSLISSDQPKERILNISGTGGIGKSSLLDQFRRICEEQGKSFFLLDSLEFNKSPKGFAIRIISGLKEVYVEESQDEKLVELAINLLNQIANSRGLVFAIDTFEEMNELDDWLRQSFLSRLSSNILVVLSGRFPLKGGWVLSPAWRRLIKFLPLTSFDFETCKRYTANYGSFDNSFIKKSFLVSTGHPLTLSLYMGLNEVGEIRAENEGESVIWNEAFKEIARQWLRETSSTTLRELLEAVTMVRVFNQEIIEYMVNAKILSEEFEQLIQLSFVRKTERGWYMHQVLRKALHQDFRVRKPQVYQELRERSIQYLYKLFSSQDYSLEERSLFLLDFIYIVGDPGFRAMFYDDTIDQNYYYETVQNETLEEAENYFKDVLANLKDVQQDFYDPLTNKNHLYEIPKAVNERLFSSINLSQLIPLGKDVVRLLKNEKHEAVGIVIYIPIHRDSLSLLEQNPITRSYFIKLSELERKRLQVPPETPAGWFQYLIDFYKDGRTAAARFMYFKTYVTYFLKGGILVYTSPLAYNQEVVKGIGAEEVPNSIHNGFGKEYPAPYFVLDFRDDHDLKKFVQHINSSIEKMEEVQNEHALLSKLTPREREIALLAKTCSSNMEIAEKLYLSEITVKKNLSRIYEKLEVRGKTELIKKLMS